MNEINFTTQSSFLHHGIMGQKWGIQNGPPYPLDRATAKEVKKQAKHDLNNTEAAKAMNKGTMIGAAVGQFVAGPIGAGAGASLGSYIAFNKLSPEVKNEYYDKVKKYSDAKDQYKIVKKYEKVSLKEAKKISKYNGILDSKTNYDKNKLMEEAKKKAEKQQKEINKKSDKELYEDLRKEGDKIFARVEKTNFESPVTKSELRNFGDKYMILRERETGNSYKSFDDFMKKEFNNDWNALQRELEEIAF